MKKKESEKFKDEYPEIIMPIPRTRSNIWTLLDLSNFQEVEAMEISGGVLIKNTDMRDNKRVSSMTYIPFVSMEELKAKFNK